MEETTTTACVAEIRYIPLYLPDASVTELTTFELLVMAGPILAAAMLVAWVALVLVVWWKFGEVERCRVLYVEEHEVAHVRPRALARLAG